MIRDDFKKGGFPINKLNPVLCITKSLDVYVAYDHFGLGLAIKEGSISKCIGVWQGSMNTDVFPLDPECYTTMPPIEHREIDNACFITVKYVNGTFSEIQYFNKEAVLTEGPGVLCKEERLLEYITAVGLKHKTVYE